MEYAFTDPSSVPYRKNIAVFQKHFFSEAFRKSVVYNRVVQRCFGFLTSDEQVILRRILSGTCSNQDVCSAEYFGYWSNNTRDIISPLLANVIMASSSGDTVAKPEDLILLDLNSDPQEGIEKLIVTGFHYMQASDFHNNQEDNSLTVRVEDALSFNWAHSVKKYITNASLQFQVRARSGRVDFFCNGHIDGAIEVLLNAVASKGGSQSFPDHLARFRSGKYPWINYALLNFDMRPVQSKKQKLILPECTMEEQLRLYTYVHRENALYRGTELIKRPAVRSLEMVGKRHIYVSPIKKVKIQKRSYLTLSGPYCFMHSSAIRFSTAFSRRCVSLA
jgi:hypothetical protein